MEARSRRHQVLIVDDDADVRHQLAHFLRSRGHTPIEVGSGGAARQWIACHQVDGMVLDVTTPGSGGLEFLQELRATETWRHLPILVLSPVQASGEVIRAIHLGANDCISKPFEADVLVARLESHLRYHELVTRLRKQNELLGRLAVLDELTQLYNRRAFMEALTLELEHTGRRDTACALMFVDLDHFKNVNDTYGHQAGDEVLQQVARRLEAAVRDADVVGRYGGEEFCVIIPEVELDLALAAGERLRRAISNDQFSILNNEKIQLTTSVGIAWRPPGNLVGPKELIQVADQAMYHAKRYGRNRVYLAEASVDLDNFSEHPTNKVATPCEEC